MIQISDEKVEKLKNVNYKNLYNFHFKIIPGWIYFRLSCFFYIRMH